MRDWAADLTNYYSSSEFAYGLGSVVGREEIGESRWTPVPSRECEGLRRSNSANPFVFFPMFLTGTLGGRVRLDRRQ